MVPGGDKDGFVMAHAAPKVVIIGAGDMGLPLAFEAVSAGLECVWFDNSPGVTDRLKSGHSHVGEVTDTAVQRMLAAGFRAATDSAVLSHGDVIVICVPTPLSTEGGLDLLAVKAAASGIVEHLVSGQLGVLESTTYPATTEEVLVPILESSGLTAGCDFNVSFSPELIDQDNEQFGVWNTPKVVGGLAPECTRRVTNFYAHFVEDVVVAKGVREAEMTKLLENTYRHVNIAVVNAMVRFCHELNFDLWDSIRCASTKPFGFQTFLHSPGVGSHRIPIYPNYSSHRVKTHLGQPFRFVELAQEINAGMPLCVTCRIQDLLNGIGKSVTGSKVALLGVTYKPGISDQREPPAVQDAEALINPGALASDKDPFVSNWSIGGSLVSRHGDVKGALHSADITALRQAHRSCDLASLSSSESFVLDTRGALSGPSVNRR